MTATSAVITSAALAGYVLATNKAMATIPIAFQFAAMMATAIPASLYMKRVGRRLGFITGAAIGATGGTIATVAILSGNFWLFCAGTVCIGSFNGFAQYFRFAAADIADAAFRSRAISLVLAGGIVAAITGPNLARLVKDLFDPVAYAGTFAAIVLIYLLIATVMLFVRIPRPGPEERADTGRSLAEIVRQPKFVVALLGAVTGYVVMSFLMTITPLAMIGSGFRFGDSALVIQAHIIGMFLPSFFTGGLIARYGVANIMLTGALLQAACVVINLGGIGFENFAVALFLVGVGWNFLFIGATTMLTECYAPAEKAKTQGLNDFCIWGSVMVGALTSGAAHHAFGWTAVNLGVAPLILVTAGATLWLKLSRQRAIS